MAFFEQISLIGGSVMHWMNQVAGSNLPLSEVLLFKQVIILRPFKKVHIVWMCEVRMEYGCTLS